VISRCSGFFTAENFQSIRWLNENTAEVRTGFEPLFFHIQGDFRGQRPFSAGSCGTFSGKLKKNLSQSSGRWIVGFHEANDQRPFCLPKSSKNLHLGGIRMLKDTRSQKQKFMDELGHQLQRRKLDTQQMNDGLLHVKWNEQKLCTVDSSGAVRFRAGDILDAEAEHQLQSVMHMAKQVKEYMQILELAPSICVHGPDDRRKVFADFGDVVLVGSAGRKIVDFATWEWDYGRSAVYAGHFFSDNYEAAKQDFAVRAGFVNGQRLFSDQQLGVIRNACEFALEGDATLSFEEEKLLRSVQEQIEDLFPIQQEPEQELEREQEPELEREQEQEPEQAPGQEAEQEQRFGMEMTM
jgi:hypothetical protein